MKGIKYDLKGPRVLSAPVSPCVCPGDYTGPSLSEDQFSDGFMARLSAVPYGTPTDFLLILFLPPLLAWTWILLPYAAPDQPAQSQGLYAYWGAFHMNVMCQAFMPTVMATVAGVRRDWWVDLKLHTWTLVASVTQALWRVLAAWMTGIFPVPMASVIGAAWVTSIVPFMWFCIPRSQRDNYHFRKRGMCAVGSLMTTVAVFGLAFPMMNVAAVKLPTKWQALIILVYTSVDFGFDLVGHFVARFVGADVMPCLLFAGTVFFEFNMNVAFAGGFDPLVFAEGLLIDLLKNLHEIYSLVQIEAKRKDGTSEPQLAAAAPLSTEEDAISLDIDETAQAMPHDRPHELFVASMMMLRLFTQLIVPIHFLASFVVVRYFRPELNDLVCALDESDFHFTVLMISINIIMQLVLFTSTICYLHRFQVYPLHLLQGLLRVHRGPLLTTAICASSFFLSLQNAHAGNDFQFNFVWVHDRHARWNCGLQWTARGG